LSILLFCGLLEIFAGTTLSGMKSLLERSPGLIIMVPAMLDLRGDLSGSLAARLSSGLHLGVINKKYSKEITENLKATLFMSVILPTIIALFAFFVCRILSIPSIGLLSFIFIAVCTGLTSGIVLSILSIVVTFSAFRHGLDPDNIAIPILATLGDLIVVLFLFLFTMVIS
jgi:mgtE-like transporter